MTKTGFLAGASLLAMAALTPMGAVAQDGQNTIEEVVVTGSLIRGTPEDAALPVDVISAEELQKQGSPSTVELIKSLAVSNGVLGDTNQFDSRAQGSEGSGSVNLRGLGSNRTLVLLNGRRMAINPLAQAGAGIVDTNMIPGAAIGRIEVLKDGAAATYGSDAIGGVVNFITRNRFDGAEFAADYRYVDGSDGGDYSLSALWGWSNDRMDVMLSAGWQHRGELDVIERDWANRPYLENPEGGWTAAGNPGTFLSFTAPAATGATLFRDPQCATLGGTPGFSGTTPACYEHYIEWDNLVEKEEHYQVYGQFNYEFNDNHKLHLEGLYGRTEVPKWETTPSYALLANPTPEALAGAGALAGALYAGRFYVPTNNPGLVDFAAKNPQFGFLTTFGAAYLAPAARPFLVGGNPMFDNGPSRGERYYDFYRFSGGLNGTVGGIGYDVALTYSEEKGTRTGYDTLVNRLELAIRGFGGPNCNRSANTPGANGCLWYNPFSNAIQKNGITGQVNPQYNPAVANSAEVTRWFFQELSTTQKARLLVADAVINGDLGISFPGGDAKWALGVQYRKDWFKSDYNDISNSLINPCINTPDFGVTNCPAAQRNGPFGFLGVGTPQDVNNDVSAFFGELQLPIFESFNVQLAARYEDYGGAVGSTFDPKVSARWQVAEWLAMRGSVGTTFRGPPLAQLSPGNITSLQSILGTFRAVDIGGNPNMEPESATTYSLGVMLEAGGFKGSIDYFSFDFDNPIVSEPVAGIVNAVFPNGAGGANNCSNPAFAELVARFTFNGGTCSAANIARLQTFYVNGSAVKTSGLDFMGTFDFGQVLGGEFMMGGTATWVREYEVDAQAVAGQTVAPAFDAVGFLNYQTTVVPIPEWKGQAFAEWERGDHLLRVTVNYIDSYIDQRTTPFIATPNTNNTVISGGKTIGSYTTVDMTYRLRLPGETTVTLNVDNAFDEDPPFARLDLNYDPFTADALGRTIKLGIRKAF
ncbi:TonB-dependent receptor [Caulobacter sp. NIBR2454]|uniref:TonB-dependent receptor n=1 Tax=Caulobacter sp. NIBR2454 TaxID=3015996 RepID=UPI0022B6CCAF|nr:TonB-dependent receptor [Caulobacter sp. NIBR2454]